MADMVGTAEIAARLGISRSRVNQIQAEDDTFPEPDIELPRLRLWPWSAVEKWAKVNGRLE